MNSCFARRSETPATHCVCTVYGIGKRTSITVKCPDGSRLVFRYDHFALFQYSRLLIVFDIPLLVGSELRSMCDLVVMVRASLKTRLQRVVKDRGWKKGELKRREAYQPSIEEKEAEADVVINNNGSLEDLEREIESFLQYIQNINRN
ncbi:MAG: dephospho-CoA kinase [Planctomycetota bacterium]